MCCLHTYILTVYNVERVACLDRCGKGITEAMWEGQYHNKSLCSVCFPFPKYLIEVCKMVHLCMRNVATFKAKPRENFRLMNKWNEYLYIYLCKFIYDMCTNQYNVPSYPLHSPCSTGKCVRRTVNELNDTFNYFESTRIFPFSWDFRPQGKDE